MAATGTDTYTVERSVTIAAPPGRVCDRVAEFPNWPNGSPRRTSTPR